MTAKGYEVSFGSDQNVLKLECKQNRLYPHNEIFSATKRNDVPIYATKWINLENIKLMKEARLKDHTLYGPIYIKRPEQANPEGQKADYELLEERGAGSQKPPGLRFLWGAMKMPGIQQWLGLLNLGNTLKSTEL